MVCGRYGGPVAARTSVLTVPSLRAISSLGDRAVRIDLHAHSTASDGADTPSELVRKAAASGLDVVALTDHDTVAGHPEAIATLRELGTADGVDLTLVTGAELSCRAGNVDLHILAYLFDPAEPVFAAARDRVRQDRFRRGAAMVARCRDLGAPITWERVRQIAGPAAVARPHIAEALVEAGVVGSLPEAFTDQWISDDGRAYLPKYALDPVEAVHLVGTAGGVTVFAHPGAAGRGKVVSDEVIAQLASSGLAGLEVDHTEHDRATRERLRALAGDLGLLVTGSSDYHGRRKPVKLGENTTDPDVYRELVRRATGAAPVPSR